MIKPLISPDPKNIKWTYFTDLAVAYEDDAKLTINITSPKTLEERLLVEETILGDKMSLEEFFPSSKAKKIYFKVGETSYEITY